jgi:hypothetical protein
MQIFTLRIRFLARANDAGYPKLSRYRGFHFQSTQPCKAVAIEDSNREKASEVKMLYIRTIPGARWKISSTLNCISLYSSRNKTFLKFGDNYI